MLGYHSGGLLFSGGSACSQFAKSLNLALADPDVEMVLTGCGVNASWVATHTLRKSAATYASGGTTAAPAVFSILQRGGWSIGDVLRRYIYKMAEAHKIDNIIHFCILLQRQKGEDTPKTGSG